MRRCSSTNCKQYKLTLPLVLATCGIRSAVGAFEKAPSRLLLLADSEEEEYNCNRSLTYLHKGVTYTVLGILTCIRRLTGFCLQSLHHRFVVWTKPGPTSIMLGTMTDLARSKSELVAENALLRQQLIILRRQVKRPACTKMDRMLLVLLAKMARNWKQALFIVQPETLLRWHRQGFKLYWKYKSRAPSAKPKISGETVALIKEMASNNRLWGAERIRGELLKLDIHVCLPHHPEVHEICAPSLATRTEVEHFLTYPCTADLGLRLSPGN